MKEIIEKYSSWFSIIKVILFIIVAYKLFSQQSEIRKLENLNAQVSAQKVIIEKQGEINVTKKESAKVQKRLEEQSNDYDLNKRLLERLKSNRPRD